LVASPTACLAYSARRLPRAFHLSQAAARTLPLPVVPTLIPLSTAASGAANRQRWAALWHVTGGISNCSINTIQKDLFILVTKSNDVLDCQLFSSISST